MSHDRGEYHCYHLSPKTPFKFCFQSRKAEVTLDHYWTQLCNGARNIFDSHFSLGPLQSTQWSDWISLNCLSIVCSSDIPWYNSDSANPKLTSFFSYKVWNMALLKQHACFRLVRGVSVTVKQELVELPVSFTSEWWFLLFSLICYSVVSLSRSALSAVSLVEQLYSVLFFM